MFHTLIEWRKIIIFQSFKLRFVVNIIISVCAAIFFNTCPRIGWLANCHIRCHCHIYQLNATLFSLHQSPIWCNLVLTSICYMNSCLDWNFEFWPCFFHTLIGILITNFQYDKMQKNLSVKKWFLISWLGWL